MILGGEGTEESLWNPQRVFVLSVTENSVKTVECEYVPRCALYVSFHDDLRRDRSRSIMQLLQRGHMGV